MINIDYYKKWSELENTLASNNCDEIVTIFLPTNSYNNVFISGDKKGNRSFSIEFSRECLDKYTPQKIAGINIEVRENKKIDSQKIYLIIDNVEKKNEEAFLGFSVTVFNAIEEKKSDFETIEAFEDVINQYHDFFSFKRSLSKLEEQGLVAELLFLKTEIQKKGEDVVKNWYGCEKNKRDFIFDDYGVEIKSTRNQEQVIVHVSNENQLDKGTLSSLFLKVFVFDENATGETVSSCIKDVFNEIHTAQNKKIFYSKVAMHGINPMEYVSKYSFVLECVKTYLVDDNFPKIIGETIPSYAFDVKYRLNLSDVKVIDSEECSD